ncbi:MAG: hypothetical protein KF832_29175 [Caldilineaceae bacterium]|nr:hypothetical protein [Caldilineaceae bacterium]
MKATLSSSIRLSLQHHFTLPQSWIEWLALGTIMVVALFAFSFYPATDHRRWAILGLTLLFLVAQVWPPELAVTNRDAARREQTRLGFLTLVTLGMIALEVNFTAIIILYFILSGRALFLFPNWMGYGWIALFGAISTVVLAYLMAPDWLFGILNGLGTTCGYLFLGSAANAQRRAEVASAESKRLLQELQTAHQQLQAYAAHAEALAIAEERNRLAREMHDTLGHRLTVAAVQLEGAQKLVERDPAKASQMIGTVREQVREGLQELRHTVAALRTPLEAELPLRTALTHLTTHFREATGLPTTLVCPVTLPALSTAQRQALYRAAQEALTNIQRHAQASYVWMTLTLPEDSHGQSAIELTMADDGIGIAPQPLSTGYGLRGLEERATQLGGTLRIQPRLGKGTQMIMRLPLALPTEPTLAHSGNGHDS